MIWVTVTEAPIAITDPWDILIVSYLYENGTRGASFYHSTTVNYQSVLQAGTVYDVPPYSSLPQQCTIDRYMLITY